VAEWCSDGGDAGNREELESGKKLNGGAYVRI
jgi:hypothetical protein